MSKKSSLRILLLVLFLVILPACRSMEPAAGADGSKGLWVGAAAVEISPRDTVGVDLAGYEQRLSEGLHDPVTVRCLVIDDGSTEIGLVAVDISNLFYPVVKLVLTRLARETGIPAGQLFLAATHTFSAPSPEYYLGNPQKYDKLYRHIAECVTSAQEEKAEATAIYGQTEAAVETINRNDPSREVENLVKAIEFRDLQDQTIAVLVNFACHPVVLGPDNLLISSDYVHYLRERLEESVGGTAVFFGGASGDINPHPVNPQNPWNRIGGTFEMAQELGEGIADAAVMALEEAKPLHLELQTASTDLRLRHWSTRISLISLGEVWIIAVPGEPVASYNQILEDALPAATQLVFSLVDDRVGYIMPQDEWEEFIPKRPEEAHRGSETWAATLTAEYQQLAEEMMK